MILSIHYTCRHCFVSNHDLQTLRCFVTTVVQKHKTLYYAKISDSLWSRFILDMSQDFLKSHEKKIMTLVTAVGKQPSSDVWVLGPTIQINKDGELISKERQLFFW